MSTACDRVACDELASDDVGDLIWRVTLAYDAIFCVVTTICDDAIFDLIV